jgi:hypothetical protein
VREAAVALTSTSNAELLESVKKGAPFSMSAPQGHYYLLNFGSPQGIQDGELHVKFRIRVSPGPETGFSSVFRAGLFDCSRDDIAQGKESQWVSELLGVQIGGEHGNVLHWVVHGDPALELTCMDPHLALDGKTVHELRVIRVGSRGEVYLDNKRLAFVPIPRNTGRVGFTLKSVGMDVSVLELDATEIQGK